MRINGKDYQIPSDWASSTLLSFLRDYLGLMGTKYGCGKGLCGACTVHVNGSPLRSCQLKMATMQDTVVTTIEGLALGDELHPVQQAWLELNVAQCGYCQPGQMMSAAGLLNQNANPKPGEIRNAMQGNLCRCGTYGRIHKAVSLAARIAENNKASS